MKLNELISLLSSLAQAYGDCEVNVHMSRYCHDEQSYTTDHGVFDAIEIRSESITIRGAENN